MKPKISENRWEKGMEDPLRKHWRDSKKYAFEKGSHKPVYSIDTPPPYVNTPVHIGQATTYVLMDMFARFRRMTGHNVLFPFGLDRNGLPIEMMAEKRFGKKLHEVAREEFIKMCRKVLEESSVRTEDYFYNLGISFNSWSEGNGPGDMYMTDSPAFRVLTQASFIDLWKKGLVYEDERINNYCPGCRTTIADAEVLYAELPSRYNHIIFRVKDSKKHITIATTRPELIATCAMVIYNPSDKRYADLEGKTAVTPLFNKEVPIKAHPLADPEKGTGIMMMCSAGDLSDIRFFREQRLDPVIAIGPDGKMNGNGGFLEGLKVKEARENMVEKLREQNLLVKQEDIVHRTPICERSKDPIEFISMKEFYLKQIHMKPKMKELAKKMNFYSPDSRQLFLDWIESVSIDWPISRRRYYATEIPLWYCSKCGETIVPEKGRYYQPWKESPPVKSCHKCGSVDFRGEERVFDTWFDSSMTPLYILLYGKDDEFFRKHTPCSLRPQGKEIIRTWLYYTVLKDFLLTGLPIFRDVWINYHVLDGKGKKMSKSKGNVVEPGEVIEKFGAEPFRLWCAVEGNLEKTDFRFSPERVEGAQKTLTKLWNVARFISMFPAPEKRPKLAETDEWILSELSDIVREAGECFGKYDFHNPSVRIKHFIWETLSSHYLELVKSRAYNQENKFWKEEAEAAAWTLSHVLETLLKVLAPVNPFITEKLYRELTGRDVHSEKFPEPEKAGKIPFKTEELESLNSQIWKIKKDAAVSLKAGIKKAAIPEKFKSIEKDFKACHNIKELSYGKLSVELE